jgi:hypothetical protein
MDASPPGGIPKAEGFIFIQPIIWEYLLHQILAINSV